MENICGVIDAQGFLIMGDFYIREVSFAPMESSRAFHTNVRIPWHFHNLSEEDKKRVRYCERYIHGMKLNLDQSEVSINHNDIGQKLKAIYEKLAVCPHDVFGVKNHQLSKLLDKWGIPNVDLETFNCPSVKILREKYKENNVCERHSPLKSSNKRKRPQCAVDKTALLWFWVRDNWYKP